MNRDAQNGAVTMCLLFAEHHPNLYKYCLAQLTADQRRSLSQHLASVARTVLESLGELPPYQPDP